MIAATRRWVRRNRNGLAVGVGIAGAAYVAGQYIVGKISEAKERMALDRIAKENLKRRFEQNQTDCTFTVLALLPTVTENVLEALPVEQLTHELQRKKAEKLARSGTTVSDIGSSEPSSTTDGADVASLSSLQSSGFVHTSQMAEARSGGGPEPRRTKQQLWAEIKIQSISRALTLIYSLSLLTLLTRIQLNLLGRLNYISSVLAISSPSSTPPTTQPSHSRDPSSNEKISLIDSSNTSPSSPAAGAFEINRRYLTFSWWLLHRGSALLRDQITTAVTEVFGAVPVTESLTSNRLSSLILQIRQRIEGATDADRMAKHWLPYLLPPSGEEELVLREAGVLVPSTTAADSESSSPTSSAIITPDLRHLLNETADLIESPHFTHIMTLLLNSAYGHLIDHNVVPQAFPPPPLSGSVADKESLIEEHSAKQPTAKLANVLAIVTRQAHALGRGGDGENEYLTRMESEVKEVEAFAAVVFTRELDRDPDKQQSEAYEREKSMKEELRAELGKVEGELENVWGRIRGQR